MRAKYWCAVGLAALIGNGAAQAQTGAAAPVKTTSTVTVLPATSGAGTVKGSQVIQTQAADAKPDKMPEAIPAPAAAAPAAAPAACDQCSQPPADEGPLGPTPPSQVKCLQDWMAGQCQWFAEGTGCDGKKTPPCLTTFGWMDFDYTYRSTGHGETGIAPVMNRFGDEALVRQLGWAISKPLDPKCLSFGFNSILIAGADAAFLNPTAGWPKADDPRFGLSFTDLNATAHLPILTEGGVDVKAGRQTTVLGPMGALPFQRYFDSSDYAWFNLEEGRYTGVAANWHITKRLDWYNAIEIGGWGVFFDNPSGPCYLGQINYWLDEDAKKAQLTFTVLTGPTGVGGGNTTTTEITLHLNPNKYVYDVFSNQITYSKAPVFFQGPPPPGYQERAYDIYNYLGVHCSKCVDFNTRWEWYKDVDGGGYAGGFGIPHTNYFELTLGIDYHPNKWLQVRPEIRGDFADHDAFGENKDKKDQLSLAVDALIKF
jgi:hypothetical protein